MSPKHVRWTFASTPVFDRVWSHRNQSGLHDAIFSSVSTQQTWCGRVILGHKPKPSTEVRKILKNLKMSGNKNSKMMSEMMKKEIKWKEKSKRSEATLTMHMKHEDDYGWTETQTWATMGAHLNNEDIQKTMTLTGNKEERLTTKIKDLQCMMAHALASTTLADFPNVSNNFSHCWYFHSALRVNNSVAVAVPIHSISDMYANSLERFTLRKWFLWNVVFTIE